MEESVLAVEREHNMYMATLAEQAERHDEVVESMKQIARMDIELTHEERHLLSVGYKKVIGARRDSCRILSSLEKTEEVNGTVQNVTRIRGYRRKIEDEISKICNDALAIIAVHLLPSSATGEALVFFYKMKGDFYRYLAEFRTGNERQEAANQSLWAYQTATGTAMTDLPSTHPVRLGLALNFAVFYYEIMGSTQRACQLAKQAFDEAITEINALSEQSYKDSMVLMELLKGNLTLWTSDQSDEAGEQSGPSSSNMES